MDVLPFRAVSLSPSNLYMLLTKGPRTILINSSMILKMVFYGIQLSIALGKTLVAVANLLMFPLVAYLLYERKSLTSKAR